MLPLKSAFALVQASVNGKSMWPRRHLLFEPLHTLLVFEVVCSARETHTFFPISLSPVLCTSFDPLLGITRLPSPLLWRCAANYFIEAPPSQALVELLRELGPSYTGHLQGGLAMYQGWPLATAPQPRAYGKLQGHPVLEQHLPRREQGMSIDLSAVAAPVVPAEKVWLSLHAHSRVQAVADEALQVMGGPMAGAVFGRNADVNKGTGLLPSLANGVQYPPFAHLTGESRTFAGRSLAMSLDQVGGVAVCLKLVADASSAGYLENALELLSLVVRQCPRNARDLRDSQGFQVLAGLLMARHRLISPSALNVLLTLCAVADDGAPHFRLVRHGKEGRVMDRTASCFAAKGHINGALPR